MKIIVCDSSSLISLAEACSLGVLGFMKEKFKADFVIPPAVEQEIVETPHEISRFSYSAARLKHLINVKILRVASVPSLDADAQKIMDSANSLFRSEMPLRIIQRGEAECLALLSPMKASALLVDEKTTRLLMEDPKKLLSLMKSEHAKARADEKSMLDFQKKFSFTVLRSTELVSFAAQNGFFQDLTPDENDIFHTSIYALRYAGCSISQSEIDDYQKITI